MITSIGRYDDGVSEQGYVSSDVTETGDIVSFIAIANNYYHETTGGCIVGGSCIVIRKRNHVSAFEIIVNGQLTIKTKKVFATSGGIVLGSISIPNQVAYIMTVPQQCLFNLFDNSINFRLEVQ